MFDKQIYIACIAGYTQLVMSNTSLTNRFKIVGYLLVHNLIELFDKQMYLVCIALSTQLVMSNTSLTNRFSSTNINYTAQLFQKFNTKQLIKLRKM